jgi:hypothetical protein
MKIHLYGLLHLDEKPHIAMNLRTRDFDEQISIFIGNATNLSDTLRSQGLSFTLLTNRKDVVDEHVQPGQFNLQVEEIPFITEVPGGIPFYSAHFKLDAFRYLSTLSSGYVGLCDLDMVCLNGFPACLHNIVKAKLPLFYDISDQVIPAYGHEVIIKDLKLIHGIEGEGRWYGGEYISGSPEFFGSLVKEIESVYPNYIAHISTLHHVGNETFTTAGLELLRRKGMYYMGDAGTLGIVGRYWSIKTLHPQKSFEYFQHCFLLHLPADKKFLAEIATRGGITRDEFLRMYATHRKVSFTTKIARKIRSLVKHIMPGIAIQRKR